MPAAPCCRGLPPRDSRFEVTFFAMPRRASARYRRGTAPHASKKVYAVERL